MHPAISFLLPFRSFPFALSQLTCSSYYTSRVHCNAYDAYILFYIIIIFDDFLSGKRKFSRNKFSKYFWPRRYKYESNKSRRGRGRKKWKARTKSSESRSMRISFGIVLKNDLTAQFIRTYTYACTCNQKHEPVKSESSYLRCSDPCRQAHRILKFTRRYTVSRKLLETTNFAYQCAWIHPRACRLDKRLSTTTTPHRYPFTLPSTRWILDSFSSRSVISLPSCYSRIYTIYSLSPFRASFIYNIYE